MRYKITRNRISMRRWVRHYRTAPWITLGRALSGKYRGQGFEALFHPLRSSKHWVVKY